MSVSLTNYVALYSTCLPVQILSNKYVCLSVCLSVRPSVRPSIHCVRLSTSLRAVIGWRKAFEVHLSDDRLLLPIRLHLLSYSKLAGYPALLGPLPLYFFLPIRYSFLPSLPRITRLRPEYLQCNNRRG